LISQLISAQQQQQQAVIMGPNHERGKQSTRRWIDVAPPPAPYSTRYIGKNDIEAL